MAYTQSILAGPGTVLGFSLPFTTHNILSGDPWQAGCGVEEMVTVARQAESSGFFYLSTPDHIMIPRDLEPVVGSIWYDTVATLGYLAASTSRIRLLSHIYVPSYRHPLGTAKAFSTLDKLSGGRVILGVGTGHFLDEFNTLGVPYEQRGELTDEAIDILRAAFSDEYPEIKTRHWDIKNQAIAPRPVQQHLPIWVGGAALPALRRAAQRGDGWLPMLPSYDQWLEQVATLRKLREQYPTDTAFDIGAWQSIHIGEDWSPGDDTLCASIDQIAEQLQRYITAGANHIQLQVRSRSLAELLDQMQCIGTELAPLLQPSQ